MKYFYLIFTLLFISFNSLAIRDGGGPCNELRAIAECDPASSPNSIRIDILAPAGISYTVGGTTYSGNTFNIGVSGPFLIDMSNNPLALVSAVTGSGTMTITNFRCYSGGAFTGLLCTDNASLGKSFGGGTQPNISGGTGTYSPGASVSLTASCLTGTLNWYTGSCGGTNVGTGSPFSSTAMSTTTYYARCEDACNTTTCDAQTVTRSAGGSASAGDFEWVQTAHMSDCAEESNSTDIDASPFNDLYTVGFFGTAGVGVSSTLNFGGGNTISTAANTGIDNFIVKYDSAGNTMWAGKISTGNDEGRIVRTATDPSGNLFVTAKLRDDPSDALPGGLTASGTIMGVAFPQTSYTDDGLLAKLDSAGNVLWQRQFRGTSNVHLTDVATDASGNVYVCGGYKDGSFTVDGNTYTGTADFTSFIAKFNSSGTLQFWKEASTDGNMPHRLYVDGSNNVHCLGIFFFSGGPMTIEGQTFSATASQPLGHYIIKYNSAGTFQWVRSGYGNQIDLILTESPVYTGYELTVDAAGNVYLAHSLRRLDNTTVQYDYNGSALSFSSPSGSSGCRAYVLSKYNSSGTLLSISGDGVPVSSFGPDLKFDGLVAHPNGFVYGSINYAGTIQINDTIFTAQSRKDIAILEFNNNLTLNARYRYGVGTGPGGHTSDGVGLAVKPNGYLGYAGNITRPTSGTLPTLEILYDNGFGDGVCGTDRTSLTGSWIPDVCAPPIISGSTADLCESNTRTFMSIVAGPGPVWTVLTGGGSINSGGVYTPANVSVNTTVQIEYSFSCAPSARDTITFTVVPDLPQPTTITGTTPVCSGSSQTYSVTNVVGATYAWSYSGGGTATSTTNSVTFTPTSSGTLSVTASNACGTSPARTLAITVDAATPSQPSTISGTNPVCSGSSQTYSVTNIAGVTYAWSYSGGGTATSTTNSVTFTPTSSGTLSVTASNSCGTSAARNLAITVDAATPSQPSTISGTNPVCSGSSQTYSVTNVAGVTYSWSYSGGGTATSTTNSVTFTPTSSGTLSVTASNSCGTSTARTLAITVDAATPSTPSAITGSTNICSSSQTYSVTNVAGVTYAWSYSGGGTATSTTNSVTFTPTSSGTLSVTASNSCGTSAASTLGITVSGVSAPAQPSAITGTTPVCSGSSQTYSVTNVAGVTYAWSYSGGGTATSTTNSVTFTPTSNGTLSVTATNACGTSAARNLAITVDASTPSTPSTITGTTPVCSGSSQTYSVTNVAGVTYAWSYSGGGTATSTTNSVTFTPTSSGTLSVTASNSCGTSAASTLAITVDAATPSTPSAITGTTPVCSSSQTYSVTYVAGVTYAWSYSGGGTATSTTNSVTFTPTSSGTLSVTASNSCGTSAGSTLAITVDAAAPGTPSAITGTTPVCSSSQTYSVTNVAGVTYAWSYSGGGTATSTTNSVTFTPTSSGTLSVTATNACGTSAASTLAITVDAAAPSTPSAITGTTPVCSSSQTYSVTNVAGVTYAWSYSGGGTATSTTNSVTFTPTSSGTLSVTATNACGTSAASTLTITVLSGAPSQPGSIIGSTNVCSTSETYSVTNVAGVTYTWSYTGTGSPSSTTNSVTFTPTSSGTLSVTATNACGTSTAQTLVINVASGIPAQPSAISGPASICSVSPQTYSVTNVAGVTYAWTYSGGGTPTGTINSTTFTPTSSGTLSVTASNACGTSSPQTLNIVIGTSVPATPGTISGLTTLCSSSQTYGVVPVTGASNYTWSYTGGGAPSSTTNTVTFTPTSSGTLSVTASNPCGTSAASTLNITVDNGVPATPSAITGNTIICDNSLQTYSVTNVAGVTYTWSYSGVGSPSSTTNSVSFNPTSSGTLSVIATNSCGSSAQSTINIVVDILAPVSLGSDQAVCTGSTVNLSVPNNVSYSYLWSDGAITNTFTANPTSAQTIWVRVTNGSGCVVTDTLEITITGPTTITAHDDSLTVITDRLEVLDVTNNDSQLGNINIVSNPQFGVANINGNGDLTYKSYIDFIGYDVLTYEICDVFCSLTCDTATVYLKVEHNVFESPDNGNIGSWGVTPNGDGVNDVLLIDGLYEYPDNEITIFNRWGDKIYHAKPYNQDWNGLSPKEVVNGTYFFILEIEGKSEAYKGFIHLQK